MLIIVIVLIIFFPDSGSEKSVKIGQYFTTLATYLKCVATLPCEMSVS